MRLGVSAIFCLNKNQSEEGVGVGYYQKKAQLRRKQDKSRPRLDITQTLNHGER